MSLMGITLNFMSTMAMGLVAGVLVDDAIVEIENIVRHMRMGKSAYQASLDAADEIGLAVLATTMAICAVFFPVALMPGIAGQYFKAFGFTVVLCVLMSLLVARMITPLIAAYFLRSHGAQPHAAWKWMDFYLKLLNWSLDTSKADALLARLPKPALKIGYLRAPRPGPAPLRRDLRHGHGRRDGCAREVGLAGSDQLRPRGTHRRARDLCAGQPDQHASAQARRFRRVVREGRRSLQRSPAGSSDGDGRRGRRHLAAQHRAVRNPLDLLLPAAE